MGLVLGAVAPGPASVPMCACRAGPTGPKPNRAPRTRRAADEHPHGQGTCKPGQRPLGLTPPWSGVGLGSDEEAGTLSNCSCPERWSEQGAPGLSPAAAWVLSPCSAPGPAATWLSEAPQVDSCNKARKRGASRPGGPPALPPRLPDWAWVLRNALPFGLGSSPTAAPHHPGTACTPPEPPPRSCGHPSQALTRNRTRSHSSLCLWCGWGLGGGTGSGRPASSEGCSGCPRCGRGSGPDDPTQSRADSCQWVLPRRSRSRSGSQTPAL